MNTKTDFIGNMVAEDFRTASIFKKHGIDFCNPKKLDAEKIYEEIESLPKNEGNAIDFKSWPLDLLADYVEKTHHRYVEEKTPILQAFLNKLCKVHGDRHPELFEINQLFNESAKDLGAHMKKEELILFPFVKNMVKAKISGKNMPNPAFGTVENPVNMMMHEHTVE
ncbi:MAG: hemerythrin domain-containing protein, partial [Chryseobacterium sp.]